MLIRIFAIDQHECFFLRNPKLKRNRAANCLATASTIIRVQFTHVRQPGHGPVHGAAVHEREAQGLGSRRATVLLPDAAGPSIATTANADCSF